MMSMHSAPTPPRHRPLSSTAAFEKLRKYSQLIQYREALRKPEERKVHDALGLITRPLETTRTSQAAERRIGYCRFLKKVNEATGLQLVLLCAIGLGQSAIGAMRDFVQLELLTELKKQEEVLKCAALQMLANEYSERPGLQSREGTATGSSKRAQGIAQAYTAESLEGNVYELASADLQILATSNQVLGQILLTDPYEQSCSPFVTIRISADLKTHFTTQRLRVMGGSGGDQIPFE